MSIVDDLSDLFNDTVLAVPGADDGYGTFIASGATLSLPCYIEGKERLARTAAGEQVTSLLQVYVAGYNNLTVDEYRYTLPARYSPDTLLEAVAVEKVNDENGPLYECVHFP